MYTPSLFLQLVSWLAKWYRLLNLQSYLVIHWTKYDNDAIASLVYPKSFSNTFDMPDARILMFAFGSGSASAMFSLRVTEE